MIIYDVATKIFDRNISSERPDIWHYIYCFIESGEAFTVKRNKHTHARTPRARTHTHTHTHTHTRHHQIRYNICEGSSEVEQILRCEIGVVMKKATKKALRLRPRELLSAYMLDFEKVLV